jgi:hypothetical protein
MTERLKRASNGAPGSDSCPFNSLSTFYDETAKIVVLYPARVDDILVI